MDNKTIIELLEKDIKIENIAKFYELGKSAVYGIIEQYEGKKMSTENKNIENIIRLIRQDWSADDISNSLNIPKKDVENVFEVYINAEL